MDIWDETVRAMHATFKGTDFDSDVRFIIDNGRSLTLRAVNGEIEAIEDSEEPCTTEMRLSMKDANKIAMRKLSPLKAISLLRLKVRGDMSMAIRIAGYFKQPLPAQY